MNCNEGSLIQSQQECSHTVAKQFCLWPKARSSRPEFEGATLEEADTNKLKDYKKTGELLLSHWDWTTGWEQPIGCSGTHNWSKNKSEETAGERYGTARSSSETNNGCQVSSTCLLYASLTWSRTWFWLVARRVSLGALTWSFRVTVKSPNLLGSCFHFLVFSFFTGIRLKRTQQIRSVTH